MTLGTGNSLYYMEFMQKPEGRRFIMSPSDTLTTLVSMCNLLCESSAWVSGSGKSVYVLTRIASEPEVKDFLKENFRKVKSQEPQVVERYRLKD